MRISPKQSDRPIAIRKKMLPMLSPKITPEISSCASIMDPCLLYRSFPLAARFRGEQSFPAAAPAMPQMPFSPASMMKTSRKPMNSSQLPIRLADHVLHAGEGERADERPVQRADAAENRHHHRIGGARRAGHLRADEAQIDGVHRAGQGGRRIGDDEGEQPDAEVAVAEKLELVLVDLGGQAAGAVDRCRRDICRTPRPPARPERRR